MKGYSTPAEFQDRLAEELEKLYEDYPLFHPVTGDYTNRLNVFKQFLPVSEEDEDIELSAVPYVQAILNSGKGALDTESNSTVEVVLIFSVYDPDKDRQGYKDLLSLIQRFVQRFSENPLLGNFDMTGEIEWAIGEDTYPYYFGALSTTFEIPTVRRIDAIDLC